MSAERGPRIRRFMACDLPRIVEIEGECFGADAWAPDEFLDYARRCGSLFFVAVDGSRVIGYSITCKLRVNAELASIAVEPRSRGKGVARALLRRSMGGAARLGANGLWLMVRLENRDALRLYRGMGFRQRGIVRGYYEDGADGRRMLARL
jgi:ribosomal-protein-alanine acetyltransferase